MQCEEEEISVASLSIEKYPHGLLVQFQIFGILSLLWIILMSGMNTFPKRDPSRSSDYIQSATNQALCRRKDVLKGVWIMDFRDALYCFNLSLPRPNHPPSVINSPLC